MKSVFLFPGQLIVCNEPSLISTMLGSCVGLALYDKRLRVGGLNHYLLPEVIGTEKPSPRYGSHALPSLLDALLATGASKRDLVARVYGGAAVLGDVSIGQKIGEKNIELALSWIDRHGIPIVEKSVGGDKGRKVAFNTSTGEVALSFAGGRVDATELNAFAPLKDEKLASKPRMGPSQVLGVFVSGNTGASKSVARLLSGFSKDAPPIVLAVSGFPVGQSAFVAALAKEVKIEVKLGYNGAELMKGTAYFIPEGMHGEVRRNGHQFTLELMSGPQVNGQAPSGNRLFASAVGTFGSGAAGILLSSFGSDGLQGLSGIYQAGGLTIVEDPKEASFPFVPQLAITEGIAREVARSADMHRVIQSLTTRRTA